MQSYGKFEAGRKIGAGRGTVVLAARLRSPPGPEDQAVKVFSPRLVSLGAEEDEAPTAAHLAFLTEALARIELQKRASGASPFIAPVLEQGQDEASVWYATRRYPQSLERILRDRTRISGAQARHLLLCAVRGALAFKQTCGRAHGNLKPTNLFIASTGRLQTATVVLADPLPGGPERAEFCELADLKAIGQRLYEMVRRKEVPAQDWEELVLPLELSSDWSATFGKDAPRWLALCNRLLDRQLTLSSFDLPRLEKELERLKPKAILSPIAVAAVLLLAVAGGLTGWWLARPSNMGRLALDSRPAVATLVINGQDAGKTPWSRKLTAGRLSVIASNEFGILTNELEVVAGKSTNYVFQFPYGHAEITSSPSGATVEDPDEHTFGTTPFVTSRMKPGTYSYLLRLRNFEVANVRVAIPTDGTTNRTPVAVLSAITGSNVSVIIKVDPLTLDGDVVMSNLPTKQSMVGPLDATKRTPFVFQLQPGPSQFELRLPAPWPKTAFEVVVGTNLTFLQRIPAGRLVFDSSPTGAFVWAGTNLVGVTPTDRQWPTGSYMFEWRLPYHATNRFETTLLDGAALQHRETLEELLSPVRLSANLDGARVHATNAQAVQIGTWMVGPNGTNVGLPDTNTLIAEFVDDQRGVLAPVIVTNAMAQRNFTNQYRFDFEYGTVRLEPPPGSTVSVGDRELTNRPVVRYQRPGEAVTYTVAAQHCKTTNLTLAVSRGEQVSTNVALLPDLYEVFLKVDPPVAQVRLLSSDLVVTNGLNQLPWGTGRYEATATHPRLGWTTNSLVMNERGLTQSLSLAYAGISFNTKQRGLKVFEGADELGRTPLTNVYLPPGNHKFTFASLAGSTNWSTNLLNGANETIFLPFQFRPDYLTNSLGMRLAYVAEADIYVQQFEVTRANYTAASLPLPARTSVACATPDCPVIYVGWANAIDFCAKLNAATGEREYLKARDLDSWIYSLPTESEWNIFAPASDLAGEPEAVFPTSGFASPQPISDSRRSFNRYNLYDLHGNVAEFCIGSNAAPLVVGGSFLTSKRQIRLEGPTIQDSINGNSPNVGFRVVLKPSR